MKSSLKGKSAKYKEVYNLYMQKRAVFGEKSMSGIGSMLNNLYFTEAPPPQCTTPLTQMKLMTISQLALQKVHKGCYLKLKVIFPCFKMTTLAVLCQDHTGKDCVQLSIYKFDTKGQPQDKYFAVNTVFYLKEPFYKDSLYKYVRVDNGKDIVFQNQIEAKSLKGDAYKQKKVETEQKKEETLRKQGVKLMEKNDYAQAYILYSQAISKTKDQQYLLKFLINKAIVCLKLNLLQEYDENIELVLSIDPNHKKGLYHKIKSLIFNQHYTEASDMLKEKCGVLGKNVQADLQEFLKLQKSFKEGEINWYRALKYEELGEYFSNKIKIGKSPFGLGIIATQKINPGQVLIVQRPLLLLEDSSTQSQKQLESTSIMIDNKMRENMQKLYLNSRQFREKASKLASSEHILHDKGKSRSDKEKLGSFREIAEVLQTNWFTTTQLMQFFKLQTPNNGTALYEKACMLNHCCQCNCERINLGKTMIVFALREIQVGEELFITYKVEYDYVQRTRLLLSWKIKCDCIFCTQQRYELEHGKPKPDGKSMMFKKVKMVEEFRRLKEKSLNIDKLLLYYDIQSIVLMICVGFSFQKAGKMLRRIFPMSQSQSIELLQEFMKF